MTTDTVQRSLNAGLRSRVNRRTPVQLLPSSRERKMGGPVSGASGVPLEKQPDKTKYSGRVALRIRAARKAKGKSVEDLARAVTAAGFKLATSSLYGWENGSRDPAMDAMPFLAKALGVPLHDLLPPK